MNILVFNCGSSSIKYQLFDMPDGVILAKGMVERIGEEQSQAAQTAGIHILDIKEPVKNHEEGLAVIQKMLTDAKKGAIKNMSEIAACGHRVVHGGELFTGSAIIDDALETAIESYYDLAPLHNPPNLTGIRAAKKMMPGVPQVACFDTAFHTTLPPKAYLYGLPYDMYETHMVRRYGFHGTSHRYVACRAAQLMGKDEKDIDVITCHLGNGCSMAACRGGKSVDTSMGLTPLEGLVMGTRCGDIDPAIIFHLIRKGYSPDELDKMLNKKSGLLGISGISNDVRDLQERAAAGDEKAELALEIFAYRIRKYIGAYLAVLNGCDAVVFTGGIGENGIAMRKRILTDMEALGIDLDDAKNDRMVKKEGGIEKDGARVKLLVIPTDEEGAIARDTYAIAGGGQ